MKLLKIMTVAVLAGMAFASCKKQLDIQNPNNPTFDAIKNEEGVISLASGGVYVNGFRDLKYGDGVFGLFWSGAIGFHELMADVIQAEAANAFLNQIGVPNKVILSNGQVLVNPNSPSKQKELVRAINTNDQQSQNFTYYEWAYMYSIINAMNTVLETQQEISFSGNAEAKKQTLAAWAHFWKGFAYARIGSMYYAGLVKDQSTTNNGLASINNNYVSKETIIAESNAEFDRASQALDASGGGDDYSNVLGRLIPDFNQVGKGGILTPDMWKRTMNTLKARNMLVNKTVAQMTTADWSEVLNLTNSGIQVNDLVFTGRSNATGDFLVAQNGTVSAKTQASQAGGNTYKLSERWVQEFKTGDKRFANNVVQTATWIGNSDRGQAFNTRYTLVSGGNGMPGVIVYANTNPGEYELFLAGSYEENELMKAEALIYTGQTEQGLQRIDAVRSYQGAGLAAVAGTGLTQAQAIAELRSERRVALPFIGLSFYDARRWGRIYPLAEGGGRTPAVIVKNDGSVDNNATIEYDFLDYWDVPDNEIVYNPPGAGSAPVTNPK